MKVSHLSPSDFLRQPWKNGGGVTTQLAVEGDGPQWLWRVSLAEVARSGPFSDFSGYDRTIMLVKGGGMELHVEGRPPIALRTPFESFVFDGGARTDCALVDGPITDLNVMAARDRATARVEVTDAERSGAMPVDWRWVLAYAISGRAIAITGDVAYRLNPGELLRLDDARGETLELDALDRHVRVALIRIDLK